MPVAGRTPLAKLMAAASYYCAKKGRMVTFEYVLIPGLNDSVRDAHALATLTRDIPAKINLIMFNPFPGCPYERPDEASVKRFQSVLRERGKKVMLRRSLGCDILAGCGQLGQGLRKPERP
jgi:23S rRNA (adenine2503-C2)-methyltransferase